MIAQWDSSLSVLSVARGQVPTMRRVSLSDHMSCLVHSSGSTKGRSGVPFEKSLQSHEDNRMPTDQPGL